MCLIAEFESLLTLHGSTVLYHRDDSLVECPCLTPEGFRDPEWHYENPDAEVCNERGFLSDPGATVDISVKAFCMPIQSTRATRLTSEYLVAMFGEIQADDHLGIFPVSWSGQALEFSNWSQAGDDYILYAGNKYWVVNGNLIPDPSDGNPRHHWEVGLRLMG